METVELVGRLLVSLAVVLGLIWLVARRARASKRGVARVGRLIDVLGRQQLSRSSSVAVVRVHDRAMILGITDSSVQLLSDIELDAVQAALAPATKPGAGTAAAGAPRTYLAEDGSIRTTAEPRAAETDVIPDDLASLATTTSAASGPLAGSALSPATWKQTLDALREMTARKG